MDSRSHRHEDGTVVLRDLVEDDLPIFFEHQFDPVANEMAAFPARDREAFMIHWKTKVLEEEAAIVKTVLFDGQVAGNVVCFRRSGQQLVGYWLGREFWGKGIASRALAAFLLLVEIRPLQAHVAKHNAGSIRVLEKCGFGRMGEGRIPASDGGGEIEEYIYTLATRR